MGVAASKSEKLWEACGYGRVEQVRELLQFSAIQVNWVSYTHNSCPIHACCAAAPSQKEKEILEMLIDKRCNVNAKDERGCLALHHASMKGHFDFIPILIKAGSETDVQDKNGWTALMTAAYWCHPQSVKCLLEFGSDVQLKNKEGRTALHEACRSRSRNEHQVEDVVRYLVNFGAQVNDKSSTEGEADFTPLMCAAYHAHNGAVRALIEAGCDVNEQGTNGWTALHWAADKGHKDIIQQLLQAGINTKLTGKLNEIAEDRTEEEEIKNLIKNFRYTPNVPKICVTGQTNDIRGRTRVDDLKETSRRNDASPARSAVSTMSPPSSRSGSISEFSDEEDVSKSKNTTV